MRFWSFFCPSKMSPTILFSNFSNPILLVGGEIAQIGAKKKFLQISGRSIPRTPEAIWLGSLGTLGAQDPAMGKQSGPTLLMDGLLTCHYQKSRRNADKLKLGPASRFIRKTRPTPRPSLQPPPGETSGSPGRTQTR